MFAARKKQRYWPYSMDCTGTEAHISSCKLGTQVSLDPVKNVTCENGLPAVVSCVPGQVFSPDGPSRFRKAYKPEVRTQPEVWPLGMLGRGEDGISGSGRGSPQERRRAGPNPDHFSTGKECRAGPAHTCHL